MWLSPVDRFTESHWLPSTIGYSPRSRQLGTRRVQKPGPNFVNPGHTRRQRFAYNPFFWTLALSFQGSKEKNSQGTNFFVGSVTFFGTGKIMTPIFSFCFRHYWKNLHNIGKNLLFYKKFLKKPLSHPLHRAVQNLLELKCIALKRIHFSEGAASVFFFLIFLFFKKSKRGLAFPTKKK